MVRNTNRKRSMGCPHFLFSYLMIGVFPVIFVGWKLIKRTKWLKPEKVCLRTAGVDEIDEYTRNYMERTPKTRWYGYVDKPFS
jgi:amino acid transporter